MCVRWIVRLVKRMFPGHKVGDSAVALPVVEEKKTPKKQEPMYRVVGTSRGGPNMPKRQPCPKCGKWSKRGAKTLGGAYYSCSTHGEFFVRAP